MRRTYLDSYSNETIQSNINESKQLNIPNESSNYLSLRFHLGNGLSTSLVGQAVTTMNEYEPKAQVNPTQFFIMIIEKHHEEAETRNLYILSLKWIAFFGSKTFKKHHKQTKSTKQAVQIRGVV